MTWFKDECQQLNHIAGIYLKHGKFRQAENSYRLIIDMREKNGDRDSLDLALSYYNLAELYADECRYAKASPLYKKAVELFQKHRPQDPLNLLWYSDALVKLQLAAQELNSKTLNEEAREA